MLRVALVARGNAAALVGALTGHHDFRVIDGIPADSMEAMILRDSVDAAVVVAGDFDAAVARMASGKIRLFYKSSDDFDMVKRRLSDVIGAYEKQLVADRFVKLKLDAGIVNPVTIEEHDVASMKERIGKTVGGMFPYLFVIFCFMGAMYPAIDLAAGEKERGTMETLLTAPVSRFQILLGKFAVVVLTGLLSAAVSIVGILFAVRQISDIPPEMLDAVVAILDVQTVVLVLSLLFLLVERFLPFPKDTPFEALLKRPYSLLLIAAFSITLGPLMEELFFRGFLYPVVKRRLGVMAAIVATALPFALMHAAQYGGAWASVLLIFVVGVVLAVVREKTNSLAASFLVHAAYNGTIITIIFVATSGFRHLERLSQ